MSGSFLSDVAWTTVLPTARVLVIGDVMLDRYWLGDTSRISPEAPVPVVLIKNENVRLGGAANVAHNAASLGAYVGQIGAIGEDEPGRAIQERVEAIGIDAQLARDRDLSTTVKLRILARGQQVVRIDKKGAPSEAAVVRQKDLVASLLPHYQVISVSI